jgi:hypothetical protein
MRFVKALLIASALLGLIAAAFWQFSLKGQVAYANIASAYTAKQVCSCRFIAGRELKSCVKDFTDDISALSITQKDDMVISKAPFGLAQSRARYTPKLGCALLK